MACKLLSQSSITPTTRFRAYMGEVGVMGSDGFKHLVIVKFKEGVVAEDILKGMEKLVSQVDSVKSFEWGQDIESLEMLRQGFTHAFLMTFDTKEDFTAFQAHPDHLAFSATFSAAIDNIVLLDFPAVIAKAPPPPAPAPTPIPATPAPPAVAAAPTPTALPAAP